MKSKDFLMFFFVIYAGAAWACVGARPAGMGNAFVAVADDINAVYWNPAGLAKLDKRVVSFTIEPDRSSDGSHQSSYPYFFALGTKSAHGGAALAYVEVSKWAQDEARGKRWLYYAFGRKVNEKLSYGLKFGYREVETPSLAFFRNPNRENFLRIPAVFDIGLLYSYTEIIDFGVLMQAIFNVRPGISIRPNKNLLLSYELYDAFNMSTYYYQSRFGLEYKATDNVFLRAGMNYSLTLGLGYVDENIKFDYFLQTYNSFLEYSSSGFSLALNI